MIVFQKENYQEALKWLNENYVEFPWNSQDLSEATLDEGPGLLITTEMITGKIGLGKAVGPSDTEMLKPVAVELHDLVGDL